MYTVKTFNAISDIVKQHLPKENYTIAADAAAFLEAGVHFLGGCCGTEPAHIAALTDAVRAATVVAPRGCGTIAAATDHDAFVAAALPSVSVPT